jgi:hypothetical protein
MLKNAFLEKETTFPLWMSRRLLATLKIFSELYFECENTSYASSFVISLPSKTWFNASKSNSNLLNRNDV